MDLGASEVEIILTGLVPLASTWILRIFGALVAILLARWFAARLQRMVQAALARARVEATLTQFLGLVVFWTFLGLAAISVLGVFGVEPTSFAAAVGAMGLAIGLAFQGSLSNVAAGVMLLIFKPFRVGDVVRVAGETGKVFAIELMATTLDTPDNRRIIVPNGSVFGATLENLTHHPGRRVDVAVGVEYGADLDRTREVLLKATVDIPHQVQNDELKPQAYLSALGGSSVDWSVRVWAQQENYWEVKELLTVAVKKHLDEAAIGIPFPQLDVHLDR